jgi:DNA repair ATPase RecN
LPSIVEMAPLASALISGLSVFLTELRHRGSEAGHTDEAVRAALLELESHLASWADQAATTNALAHDWAAAVPNASHAAVWLFDAGSQQLVYYADVDAALREQVGLPPPIRRGKRESRQPTLESLARVYAPEFFELLTVFDRRKEQLLAIADELERRRDDPPALEEYLRELDAGAAGLAEARSRLAEFIAREFPLGAPRS